MRRHIRKIIRQTKNIRDWLLAKIVVAIFLGGAKKINQKKFVNMLDKITQAISPVLPRTKIAKKNIKLSFPDMSEEEVNQTTKKMWGNIAKMIGEYPFLEEIAAFDPLKPEQSQVEINGLERFVKLKEEKKPAIIFTAHIGNFEILPHVATAHGLEVSVLFRAINNKYLTDTLNQARKGKGHNLVPARTGAAWELAKALGQGKIVGLLVDQALKNGQKIEFLGRTATANPLAAKLAKRFKCDIYPAYCIRKPDGWFRMELMEPIEISKQKDVDVAEVTEQINKIVEGWIKKYPQQWWWVHNRWKHNS